MAINPDVVNETHFTKQRVVGEGGFGKVYYMDKISEVGGDKGTRYAVKQLAKRRAIDDNGIDQIFGERDMLANLQHHFICNATYSYQDAQHCFIVMDLALGGDLDWLVKDYKKRAKRNDQVMDDCLPEDVALFYFAHAHHARIRPCDSLSCDLRVLSPASP